MRPYLLSVGSVRWRKGYKRSLKSFILLQRKFPALRYVIVGRTSWKKYYEELLGIIRTHHLEKVVFFLDQVNDIKILSALYRSAEVFGLLSQDWGYDVEGFGLVFLEAAAAGVSVVGTTKSGAEDAVEEGKNGFLVPCEDEKAFAEAIAHILGNPTIQKNMSRESLAWARKSAWDLRIQEYVDLYRRIGYEKN